MVSYPEHKTKKGYVYLLGDNSTDNNFKIGVTTGTLSNRIKKLQTGNPGEIYLVDYYETDYPFYIEKQLHSQFISQHVLNEWYQLSSEDISNFKSSCQTFDDIAKFMINNNPFFKAN